MANPKITGAGGVRRPRRGRAIRAAGHPATAGRRRLQRRSRSHRGDETRASLSLLGTCSGRLAVRTDSEGVARELARPAPGSATS